MSILAINLRSLIPGGGATDSDSCGTALSSRDCDERVESAIRRELCGEHTCTYAHRTTTHLRYQSLSPTSRAVLIFTREILLDLVGRREWKTAYNPCATDLGDLALIVKVSSLAGYSYSAVQTWGR